MNQEEQSDWTDETAKRVLEEVTQKSKTDAEFRKLCLSNPREAIAQVSKTPLPPNFKIRFVENEGANMTVVLGDAVSGVELQDADLEAVVGGGTTFTLRPLKPDWNQLSWMQVADPPLKPLIKI